MNKVFALLALVSIAFGCSTPPGKSSPPAALMPLVSVIVPDQMKGVCVYRLAVTLGSTNAFGAFIADNIAVMIPNSHQQNAYKLHLADVAWRLHFDGEPVNTNRVAVIRADHLYPSMVGLTNDWALDLREFEVSEPAGCIRFSTVVLDLDRVAGGPAGRSFRKATAAEWPTIYANRYRDFVRLFVAQP